MRQLPVSWIEFTREERKVICRKIRFYMYEELDWEIGQFDAGSLLATNSAPDSHGLNAR
ncbi:MAG: hypothetical protein DRR04_04415 [Gammaproteobacteria bacterium]|nr:MAG: hypothetical protein DRQ97_06630 [Gammaproteobacteria bacterium]RLA60887.1 MAG: hypothetical protein DRR04_04415 [Gammaproteobacteria bacterium]